MPKTKKVRSSAVKWTPERIKHLRKKLGDNREAFAKRFRVSWQAVRSWEQGVDIPKGPATVVLDVLELVTIHGSNPDLCKILLLESLELQPA
jgi:DNA-binding transcriptional regulator YiaG